MSDWSLAQLLSGLHDEIQQKLAIVRKSSVKPGVVAPGRRSVNGVQVVPLSTVFHTPPPAALT